MKISVTQNYAHWSNRYPIDFVSTRMKVYILYNAITHIKYFNPSSYVLEIKAKAAPDHILFSNISREIRSVDSDVSLI